MLGELHKLCSACGIYKNVSEFNKRSSSKDGLRSECRSCQKNSTKAYYEKRGGRERKRSYYINNREELLPKLRTRGGRTGYNKHRAPANSAVFHAIKRGDLIRPEHCSSCGKQCKPEAHHHNGYDKEHYLDVVWLCRQCHDRADHPEFYKELDEYKKEVKD